MNFGSGASRADAPLAEGASGCLCGEGVVAGDSRSPWCCGASEVAAGAEVAVGVGECLA